MIINPTFPGGFVTFCDDIRHEITGKMTLVGVYHGQINVLGSAPVVLSQICALIDFRFIPESVPINPIIKIYRSDQEEPIIENKIEISAVEARLFEELPKIDEGSVRFHQIVIPIQLQGLAVNDSFRLKVRAFVDDDEIRMGSLQINLIDSDSGVVE